MRVAASAVLRTSVPLMRNRCALRRRLRQNLMRCAGQLRRMSRRMGRSRTGSSTRTKPAQGMSVSMLMVSLNEKENGSSDTSRASISARVHWCGGWCCRTTAAAACAGGSEGGRPGVVSRHDGCSVLLNTSVKLCVYFTFCFAALSCLGSFLVCCPKRLNGCCSTNPESLVIQPVVGAVPSGSALHSSPPWSRIRDDGFIPGTVVPS